MADNQEFYRLDLVLKMDDRLSSAMARIDDKIVKFEQKVQKTQSTVDKLGSSKAEPKIMADTSKAEAQIERTNALLERIEKKIVRPKIEAEDKTAPKVNRIWDRLQSLTSKAWKISVDLKDDVTSKIDRMKGAMASPLGLVGMGAATVGVGSLIADSANEAMNFSAEISNIKALTQLPQDQIDQIRAKAMQLGKDTQFSTLDAAKGMTELLKAGIDVKNVMGDASQAMLDLATAGELSLPEAAEVMSTAMNAFHMTDAAHAADILAGAANASATDVHELRYSLSMCASVANGAKMSFDDTNTALAVMASLGTKGSDAGTSFKVMLSSLIPQTKQQITAMEELGLMTERGTSAFYDQEGRIKSIADIAGLLKNATANLNPMERQDAFFKIFGQDAVKAANNLADAGAEGVNKMHEAMTHFTASQVAIEKMNNAKGAIERLKGSFENFQIEALAPFEPAIAKIASVLDGYFANSADGASAKMKGLADDVLYFMECLENNEAFQQMDWGDKVVYVLDRMMESIDKWVSGPGGEQFGKVMTKLAEIGMRAFMTALLGLMKGSLDALMHGNFAGAAGLAFGASLLGGGMLLNGMYKGVKGVGGLVLGGSGKAGGVYNSALALAKESGTGGLSARLSAAKLTLDTSPLGKAFSGAADIIEKFGKRIAIIGAVADGYTLYKSDDKLKTGMEIGGGWLGALASAKAGAAFGGMAGSAFAGIGAAPGALIGGLVGGIGGYWLGEKGGGWAADSMFGKTPQVQENGLNENMFNFTPMDNTPQTKAVNPFGFNPEMENDMSIAYTMNTGFDGNTTTSSPGVVSQAMEISVQGNLAQADAYMTMGNDIADKVNQASTVVNQAMEAYGQALTVNSEMTVQPIDWSPLWQGLDDFSATAGEKITTGMNAVSEGLDNSKNNVSNIINTMFSEESFSQASTSFRNVVNEAEAGAHGIYESLTTWVGNATSYAGSQFDALVTRVGDAMKRARQAVWDAMPSPVQAGFNWLTEKLSILTGHADGGIFNQEHIARFAEGGRAEAVIPLDSSMRSRGLSLWQQAGQMLGINQDIGHSKDVLAQTAILPDLSMQLHEMPIEEQANRVMEIGRGNNFGNVLPKADTNLNLSEEPHGLSLWQQAGQMLGNMPSLFANLSSNGFTPAIATGGDSTSDKNSSDDGNSSSFTFSGMNIHIGNGKSEEEMALSIGYRILAEIKQGLENKE